MCNELKFFQRWGKSRAKERVETKPLETERSRADAETLRPSPERKVQQPRERERVFEDIF